MPTRTKLLDHKSLAPTPRKVVVVDDNDDSREMLCVMLKSSGYECESIGDGIDALYVTTCGVHGGES